MADFEKVWSVKIEADAAIKDLEKLQKTSVAIQRSLKKTRRDGSRALDDVGKSAQRNSKKLKNLKKDILGVRTSFKFAGAAAIAFSVNAIKSNVKLNESMANVQTLLSGGTEQTLKLKESIQNLARETGKPTEDLAEGLYEVVSALGESSDNMDQLRVATQAAIAGRSSTIEAVKMLSAVTKGYGDTSSEAQRRVSDLAFQTVKLGQTTFPELAASMGKVVPLAAAMNTTQEELFGTMATLTGVTGDTAEVSTQLASVYAAFMKPTEKLNKIAKQYGFESGTAMLKTKGLAESIRILSKETKGNETELAKLLKRKEALVAVLALAGGQAETYEDKLAKMKDTTGATAGAFKAQTEGINAQGQAWKKATQDIAVFSQQLGDSLAPALTTVTGLLNDALSAIKLIGATKKLEEEEKLSGASLDARGVARTGTFEQKAAMLGKMTAERRRIEQDIKSGGNVGMMESLAFMFGAAEAPMKKRERLLAETRKAEALLRTSMTANDVKAKSGVGTTNNVKQDINIKVNGSRNPIATANEIKRQLAAETKRATRSVGGGE